MTSAEALAALDAAWFAYFNATELADAEISWEQVEAAQRKWADTLREKPNAQ